MSRANINHTPPQVIAEIGVNHNGDLGMAKELVHVAAESGCAFAKFQTFNPEKLVMREVAMVDYQQKNTGGSSQKQMLDALAMPLDWHEILIDLCSSIGIQFASTGFDIDSVSFLSSLGVPFIKIPSGEITNAPLLLHIGRQNLPLILSTGMATMSEINDAVNILIWARSNSGHPDSMQAVRDQCAHSLETKSFSDLIPDLTILQCTSLYPTPASLANLSCLETIKEVFGLPVGFSDHTRGTLAPVVATSLGATIIEKHITLDRKLPGPDHKASIEPNELMELVSLIREAHQMLGNGIKEPSVEEQSQMGLIRQSLVAATDIIVGDVFTESNVTTTRISDAASAIGYWDLLGTQASKSYLAGDPI